jgi:pimeloyl-ACP methyl ester carboxylesterase
MDMTRVTAEGYVTVGSLKVRYLEVGVGGVPVVVTPPVNLTVDSILSIAGEFTRVGLRVIVVDASSFTRMNRAGKVTALSLIADKLGGGFVLLGLGQGGVVALDYVTQFMPKALIGLALVSAPRIINYLDLLPKLNKPLLLIYGINDPNAPVEEANTVKSVVNGARLTLIDGSWVSELGRVAQLVASWVVEVTKT